MMEAFIRGDDQSLNFVNTIEDHLNKWFRGEELYEELIEDLATYSPGGGEFLVDEKELTRHFQYALDRFLREGP
jgi:hypothetical protein